MILDNYTKENIRPRDRENCADQDPVESRRNLPPEEFDDKKKSSLSGEKKTGQVVKFSDHDEIGIIQSDTNNLTYPKIYIKVENNMNPPISKYTLLINKTDD